ncbi:ZIP family metal transporter [Acuticoccus sp. I52.16.1]|uniref:ZIP family metal transporter n=1 Tax=Acuticoccus sp. I52.16.1 TaxID=2928472 RepID=UPI001FD2D8A7|nr:ZIP family metal transporter [Acuticoccus sp. I52.16.1]UOM37292.1 ZIP family metal transporter [Acuticoccus sp. I52.16.1]
MSGATVFALALLTALATGLGALPFALVTGIARHRLGLADALAAGLMLAASVVLLLEGFPHGAGFTAAGAATGVLAVLLTRRLLARHDHLEVGALHGADARRAVLIVGVMTAHSFAEGIGVGVAYGGGEALGLFVTAAIALQNVPEGLAIALVLVPSGVSVGRAAGWAVVSSLPQPLFAVPAFLAVEAFAQALPFGLGFAAGAMVAMALADLLVDAVRLSGWRAAPVCLAATGMGLAVDFALVP